MTNCEKFLEGGLYAFTSMTQTGSFNQDLKTYFLSEQFKTDMQSGKWGNSITVPIEGIPFSLDMDYDESQYSEFRNRLLQTSELSISTEFYQSFYQTIPNTNLYDAYNRCKEIEAQLQQNNQFFIGFFQGPNIETDDTVVFNIRYRPQSQNDSPPKVQNFSVVPQGSIINGNLILGQELDYETLVTCRRTENRDTILTLDTDRGSFISKSVSENSISSSKDLPIGTVICSFLNFEQFSFVTKNNEKSDGIWTPKKSKWSPCDGRPLMYSSLSTLSGEPNAPDLRGLFIRGLNSFDPAYTLAPQNSNQLNPNQIGLGKLQLDAFKKHNHQFNDSGHKHSSRVPGGSNGGVESGSGVGLVWEETSQNKTGIIFEAEGGEETRPKNVSLYYYIKINP